MVTGWRRAFCTSIPKEERETALFNEHSNNTKNKTNNKCSSNDNDDSGHSPRIISSKFGFFLNPSTPRLQTQPRSSPTSLRCRTTAVATTPTSSVPNSPKLQCKAPTPKSPHHHHHHNNNNSPRLFHFTNPSSPRSPSSFSFLKAIVGLSKSNSNRCGICLQSVGSGQGTAIFTAECNHAFHSPCVASHVEKQQFLTCPVCKATWKELPLLSSHQVPETSREDRKNKAKDVHKAAKNLRVYNDDETLVSLSPVSLFNPIPELEENEVEDEQDGNHSDLFQFQGFFVTPAQAKVTKDVEVSLLPESAVLAVGRSHETRVVVLKVRAPPAPAAARRAPIDLVVVLDVSNRMCGLKSQTMKRAMRLMISSLGSNDRMSIVAFSSSSKRLLPLLRMTATGRRSARRIVDALGSTGQGMSVIDAVKKAAKVIEDRREKNPAATIVIFSNGRDDRPHISSTNQKRSSSSSSFVVSSTRFSHSEIPVHAIGFGERHAPPEDALGKCIRGLLSVTARDLRLQLRLAPGSAQAEIPAVYPVAGRPSVCGPGSVRVGDLHAGEERELLVELKVPASSVGPHHVSVRSSFRDPLSHELAFSEELTLAIPQPQAVRSSVPGIQRLRNIHVSTRAVAESRRLVEHNDLSGAYHLLSSARALLMQSGDGSAGEYVRRLEAELAELHRRRQHMVLSQRQGSDQQADEKPEPLTPTSAWRAAERLAKLAIMRKHMNRVCDLHGFENARF